MSERPLRFRIEGLPVPPSANNLFVNRKGGGRAISPRYRAWRAEASTHVLATPRPQDALSERAELLILINPAKRGHILDDITNRIKPLEDLLVSAGVLADDSIVAKCTIVRAPELPVNTCAVTVFGE